MKRQLHLLLILTAIAKQNNLAEPTGTDVEEYVLTTAASLHTTPEDVVEQLKKNMDLIGQIREQIICMKAADFALTQVEIIEQA